MTTSHRNAGRYSPSQGFTLPEDGFTGVPDVPCPESVGDDARAWWATWATSPYGHVFTAVEWQDLADTARLMDRFYRDGSPSAMAEARQHTNMLFGVATRARLHIEVAVPAEGPAVAGGGARRRDPRLRSA